MQITWLGHSSVKIRTGEDLIYIDPYAGDESLYSEIASIVLISKFKWDHCSLEKVRKISGDLTHRVGSKGVAANLYPCASIVPGQKLSFGNVEVQGMRVSNPHAEGEQGVGFLVYAEGKRIYYMADSDYYPEMSDAMPDVLLISVGGTYTASAKEAAEIANRISPKLAIPIHWGGPVGTRDDALYFQELCQFPVKVLRQGESVEL
ncbi:hypothetical protein D6825_03750 [Candidatus Woesearchaeota archaeon]|nr:MAG: hypothetical protein D6825_03750 [Candidatus Woesearchaeota archaeon]